MSRQARVLFVAHDGYRAGATIFLLNMLRWMRAHTELQFDVALAADGDMVPEFANLCRTFLLLPPRAPGKMRDRLHGWWRRWRPWRRQCTLDALVASGAYDVLYLNTITLGEHLARLEGTAPAVITHVHELTYVIRRYAHGREQLVLQRSDRVVCVSDAVLRALVDQFGCPANKAQRIHGFTPFDALAQGAPDERRARLLDPLGVPRDAWVIGLCGHANVLKGVDLAVPLLRLLPQRLDGREVHLVWVGSERADYPLELAREDARKACVGARLHLAGETRTPADWISLFDVHLVLSREESLSLVMLEAAVQGVPTVAFDETGGPAEFIGTDAGICVPYLDLPAMASAVTDLLADEPTRREMGRVARARVRERHSADVVLPQVVQAIQDVATAHAARG